MTRRSYQMQATRDLWTLLIERISSVPCTCKHPLECTFEDDCARENMRRLVVELRTRPALRRYPHKKASA